MNIEVNYIEPYVLSHTAYEHLLEFEVININERIYDPIIGRFLSPDNYIQAPDFTQSLNRYSYCLNNPLIYTDPSGESVIAAIIAGAVIFGYLGGTAANGNDFNPGNWDWKSSDTWAGIGIGAVIGGLGGWGFAAGGTALATALGSALPTFSSTSIAVASFGLAGGVIGGAAGFSTGYAGGYLYSNGNKDYALQTGGLYAGIGSAIGTTAGLIFGASEDARQIVNDSRKKLQNYYIASDGTHRKVKQYEYYEKRVNDGTAPDWMKRNYDRWTSKINITTRPSNLTNGNVVNYNNSIYLGGYRNQTGSWGIFGQPSFDLNTSLQFGTNTYNYNIGSFGTWKRTGSLNGIRRIGINTTGTFFGTTGAYNTSL